MTYRCLKSTTRGKASQKTTRGNKRIGKARQKTMRTSRMTNGTKKCGNMNPNRGPVKYMTNKRTRGERMKTNGTTRWMKMRTMMGKSLLTNSKLAGVLCGSQWFPVGLLAHLVLNQVCKSK
jgi:hypothetical protein